jgi:ABC-2 type transport system ATP-binding protein
VNATEESVQPQTAARSSQALEVEGLSFSYGGKPALDDVSFAIAPGEFVVLLGPNGAGKTTLFSLITRLYEARHGLIRIGGHELRREPGKALARLGVVFQQPTLDLDLTVRQNLYYHAALHGIERRVARERMEAQLRRLGIEDLVARRVRHLSGGQRRRVEIARALLHSPPLLVLDEPTVGLDIASRRGIVEHVHQLCAEDGAAVLWATHLIDEVHDADTLIVLDRGVIRAHGPATEIAAKSGGGSVGAAFEHLTQGEAA